MAFDAALDDRLETCLSVRVNSYRRDDEFSPITWVGRIPVYVTTLLVGLHLVAMIVVTLALAMGRAGWVNAFMLSSAEVFRGEVWRLATYPFVHMPGGLFSFLWFAVEMYLLFAFGREVERYLGRRSFVGLYAALTLGIAVVLMLFGVFGPVRYFGSQMIHLGIFVAFATLYPGVEMLFQIQARWVAWILFGIVVLSSLAGRDFVGLTLGVFTGIVSWGYTAQIRAGGFPLWTAGLRRRISGMGRWKRAEREAGGQGMDRPPRDEMEEIDPLLDKISRHGMGSLTQKEREQLEKARRKLLRRK